MCPLRTVRLHSAQCTPPFLTPTPALSPPARPALSSQAPRLPAPTCRTPPASASSSRQSVTHAHHRHRVPNLRLSALHSQSTDPAARPHRTHPHTPSFPSTASPRTRTRSGRTPPSSPSNHALIDLPPPASLTSSLIPPSGHIPSLHSRAHVASLSASRPHNTGTCCSCADASPGLCDHHDVRPG
ncbi:hypothetical protein C8Q77DRAFT_218737 [Trametes polyzona]|nr:hypothetical protein C8Q77DRAFT_218737 [Trametes polyzona]